MGGLAVLARQLGHDVSGSDSNVYPPMSTQLQSLGIELRQGYRSQHLQPAPDLVIVGNALSRGNPTVEYLLNAGIAYTSGPQWLAHHVLQHKWVLAVAGTHGKTFTSALLTWILQQAGANPGYLIGGVARNLAHSAALGDSRFFVVEADEYDTAFFDKRSKFIHYAPRTAILNNLEFDHADIFDDLAAIERQFHHLVRTVPGNGLVITPHQDATLDGVLAQGCWSSRQQFGLDVPEALCRSMATGNGLFWNAVTADRYGGAFEIQQYTADTSDAAMQHASVRWQQTGLHNVKNALAAVAAARHAGIELDTAAAALERFQGVKRRMEHLASVRGVHIYDDFAHHPSAIAATLQGMAAKLATEHGPTRLIAVIEPRSNTMQLGIHQQDLGHACQSADMVLWYQPPHCTIDFESLIQYSPVPAYGFARVAAIIRFLQQNTVAGDHVVIMSNGSFADIHQRLLRVLQGNPDQSEVA